MKKKKLSDAVRAEILRLAEDGMGTVMIAEMLGVSQSAVSNYANRHRGTRNSVAMAARICCVADCSAPPADGRRCCWKHAMIVNPTREPLSRLMAGR